jgi:PAS domain S-box-containing protein
VAERFVQMKGMGTNAHIQDLEQQLAEAKTSIASLREGEGRYRALFEAIDSGFCIIEMIFDESGRATDYRFVEANPSFERQSGLVDAVGRRIREFAPDLEDHWFERYGRVALTGEPMRVEGEVAQLGRWFDINAFRVGAPEQRHVAVLFTDISARQQSESELRESEERQAFVLRLSDALRAEPTGEDIGDRAVRMLLEHMLLDRCYIGMYRLAEDRGDLPHQAHIDSLPPMPAQVRLSDFPDSFQVVLDRTLVIDDAAKLEDLSAIDRAGFVSLGVGALINATLRNGQNNPHWAICAVCTRPRVWTQGEVSLVEEVAERTWAAIERARSDAALRESEERFTQFAKASSAGIWLRDAKTLAMEYVSPTISKIYGVAPEEILGEIEKWGAMIVPDDRAAAIARIEGVRKGNSTVHEFRIQRFSDQAFRWIRNTDFPLGGNGDPQRIGGIAEDVTDEKLNAEHQGVLLLELQHRVRNIMAVIRSIVSRTVEGADSIANYAELLSGRLDTIARVQALLTRAVNAKVSLTSILHDELSVLSEHASQFDVLGPDVLLSAKAAETMTLAVHELTTNALKYGAFSAAGGKVIVRWTTVEKQGVPWLSFDWAETGAPVRRSLNPRRAGFGTELIEGRIPYELGGRAKLTIEPIGARCHLEFPLKDGASMLETDAPKRAVVFGGAIDMTGAADLGNQRVLLLEDDYYLAIDTAHALKGVGAGVLGPFATEEAARNEIAETTATCAILDVNLAGSRSFALARELKKGGVPFVFITGYDQLAIPPDLADMPCLQKPAQVKEIVRALADALGIKR